ncbi:MAG: hypothetical protein EOO55_00585 [Hymenobacter sp.]|nr:MAG: hypothetical protein EOO55_00585 [Hymenobacter sp.]
MKTIVLHVPDEADEATVLAALRELQALIPFSVEASPAADAIQLPTAAKSPAEWEQRLRIAEASADVSYEDARQRFAR